MEKTDNQGFVAGYKNWLLSLNYSASTIYNAPRVVADFLRYQENRGRKPADWQAVHYHEFMQYTAHRPNLRGEGGLSSAHLNKLAIDLQRFQRYLVETSQGEIYTELERYEVLRPPLEVFNVSQIEALYSACRPTLLGLRQRAVLGLCYGCGLRSGEACNLNLDHIWWDRSLLQIKQSKTKTSRLVPIMGPVQEDLRAYAQTARPHLLRDQKAPQFLVTARGSRTSHQVLYKHFQSLLERLDFPQRGLHTLRHSIACHLSASGMASASIARFLGHKTLDSTQIYIHYKINEE